MAWTWTFSQMNFKTMCEWKEINPNDIHAKLEQRIPQYKGRWKSSMNEQIHNLQDFEKVERETMRHLKKLIL